MIILIIMLLFAIAVDLWIMSFIYKTLAKKVDEAVFSLNGVIDKFDPDGLSDFIHSIQLDVDEIEHRVTLLESAIRSKKYRKVDKYEEQELPFPDDDSYFIRGDD